MVVDGRIAMIGTFNLGPRSANLNTECITVIYDELFARRLQHVMETDRAPGNAWRTTLEWNPDKKAKFSDRFGDWWRKFLIPKSVLKPIHMRSYFLTLNILYFGLLTGPAMLGAVALVLIQTGSFTPMPSEMLGVVFGTAVPAVGIGAFFASKMLFERRMPAVIALPTLDEKLDAYRTELILKYALLESPAIFAFVAFLLTGSTLFFAIGAAMVGFMLMVRPTRDSAVIHLELSGEEAEAVRAE